MSEATWSDSQLAVAILAVTFTCGLWWTYFPQGHPALEDPMRATGGAEQSSLARDAFSLLHFPMICGVIAYAVAVEEALAHPDEPLSLVVRLAIAVGLLLFIGGMAVAIWRASGRLLWPRLVLVVATAGGIVAVHARPLVSLAIAIIGTVTVAVLERRADSPVVDVPE